MLDVRALAYVSPTSEVDFGSIALTVRLSNVADETGLITGAFRIYNSNTGLLVHTSSIAPVSLAAGATIDASALTDFDPPGPADGVYFVMFDGTATNALVPDGIPIHLGSFNFDVKPVGMGTTPPTHHTTHENGGVDEVSVTGLSGLLADAQTPLTHGNPNHTSTFEDQANRGIAGGYPTLPNPLAPWYPIRADGTPGRLDGYFDFCEFTRAGIAAGVTVYPWTVSAIAGGTALGIAAEANHPGVAQLRAAAGVNSGITLYLDALAFLAAGSCGAMFILRPQVLAGAVIRFGFLDTQTTADAVDGCYFEMSTVALVPGTIVGKTSSNSARSTTATSLLLLTNTWYRFTISLNATATLVTFTIYSEAGAVLWTNTLTTNIPTGAGRQTGHGLTCHNTAGGAVAICDIDYMHVEINRTLTR